MTLYAAIANGGLAVTPTIYANQPPAETAGRVMSDTAAWSVSDVLREIPGPSNSHDENFAYKTGTSYGYRDAWAIGFDGRHVIGVWAGRTVLQRLPLLWLHRISGGIFLLFALLAAWRAVT